MRNVRPLKYIYGGKMMKYKNTFTQVDNGLLEALFRSKLTAAELRVMLFIIRQTAGYHRQSHELSAGFIAKGTGLPVRTVWRVIKRLKKTGFISVASQNGEPNIICLEQDSDSAVTADIPVSGLCVTGGNVTGVTQRNKDKRNKESVSPTLDEVFDYCREMSLSIDAQRFYDYYEAIGWQRNGQPIVNWKAVARNWQASERVQPVVEEVEKDDWGRPIPPEFV